jgi:hypothetical protein
MPRTLSKVGEWIDAACQIRKEKAEVILAGEKRKEARRLAVNWSRAKTCSGYSESDSNTVTGHAAESQ